MRISDWSSDVCSSDLPEVFRFDMAPRRKMPFEGTAQMALRPPGGCGRAGDAAAPAPQEAAVGQQAEVVQQAAGSGEIGRASCRGRVCQDVDISGVAVSLKKNNKITSMISMT